MSVGTRANRQEVDFCPECWKALDEAIRGAVKVDRE